MCRSLMLVLALALTALAPRGAGAGPLGMGGSDIVSPDGREPRCAVPH